MNFMNKAVINGLVVIIAGCTSTAEIKESSDTHTPMQNQQIPTKIKPTIAIKPEIPARIKPTIAIKPEIPAISEDDIILAAEGKAITPQGRKILFMGRKMTLIDKEIIPGGCWDYANEVYNRAGYPNKAKKRQTIFKSAKKGPYADISIIQPGDFLYYINHSYGDIEHSAIFVDWVDYNNKEALMLSYGGENRQEPARYRSYDLSSVYRVIRATN